jgi:hypothetical protein
MLLINGYDRVPLLSWLKEAYGFTIVCLNHDTIWPHTHGEVYLFLVLSVNLELHPYPNIYWSETLISSEVWVLY